MTTLHLLCAGAAQGLVKALQRDFEADTGAAIQGRFGAVGAMKEALLAGEPCDIMIVTAAMIEQLVAEGRLSSSGSAALGRVRTGIAVPTGDARPEVQTPEGLQAALLASKAIYFPDPERATAGIHFAKVMRELGIYDRVVDRFRTFPNGATAMREMAAAIGPGRIGCTQVTEINYTDGVDLVAPLPQRFELATVYSAAVSADASQAELARRFVALLAGTDAAVLRADGGFET